MTKVQSGQVRKPLGVEMRIVLQCKILCVLHNVSDYSQERLSLFQKILTKNGPTITLVMFGVVSLHTKSQPPMLLTTL